MKPVVALGWALLLVGMALALYEWAFPTVSCPKFPEGVPSLCISARFLPLIIAGIVMALIGAFLILRKWPHNLPEPPKE
jgi:hypothetical protein